MAPSEKKIEITLETRLESVDLAENITLKVAGAAGFDEDDCHRIGMSVREGVINAFRYGNQEDRKKKITLILELAEERLVIHVRDEGTGFDPSTIPDPLAEENLLRTSGRGIFLMKAFMDEFAVQRGPRGGAEVVMAKHFPAAHRSNGDFRF